MLCHCLFAAYPDAVTINLDIVILRVVGVDFAATVNRVFLLFVIVFWKNNSMPVYVKVYCEFVWLNRKVILSSSAVLAI